MVASTDADERRRGKKNELICAWLSATESVFSVRLSMLSPTLLFRLLLLGNAAAMGSEVRCF